VLSEIPWYPGVLEAVASGTIDQIVVVRSIRTKTVWKLLARLRSLVEEEQLVGESQVNLTT
jgi:hypothetical protein